MDDDDYRRGKPSCHKAFPENIALLAGDALNSLAFENIAECAVSGDITAEQAVMLVSVLGRAVGGDGMVGGQVIDLQTENTDIDLATLNALQSRKTGALIEAACVMGVILSGRFEMIPAAADYAQAMGRAFQIVDDILDVTGTFEELGKPIGSDAQQSKNTYVSLMGLEASEQTARQLTMQALAHLKNFEKNEFLSELTADLLTRRN
jgi:geranylgeranyl diphosphate synthase type II